MGQAAGEAGSLAEGLRRRVQVLRRSPRLVVSLTELLDRHQPWPKKEGGQLVRSALP
ncbi:MAG: hypothetical protein HC936_11940 [Leptolyngbyaceae cyanobacterium SU_3_3]|nr:hypothetical protein [Leptolyngbyaceae cyanobacterium SU_3_3]